LGAGTNEIGHIFHSPSRKTLKGQIKKSAHKSGSQSKKKERGSREKGNRGKGNEKVNNVS
jgi:hypothetical protein